MYQYEAYGITFGSELALPELLPRTGGSEDVMIQLGRVDRGWSEHDGSPERWQVTPDEAYLAWDQVGSFLVRNGTKIIVDPWPGAEERLVRLPLLGTVLAALLIQRCLFVMHASAVAIDRSAVVFLGGKGWGKSTLAAGFCAQGHGLLADDVVALDVREGEYPQVLPGFPQLKLWPDAAAAALGDDPATLPPLMPGYEKRARAATSAFVSEALPLRSICVIADGPSPGLMALKPQEAVVRLISHSYAARFGTQLLRDAEAARHFRQCTDVLKAVPAFSLERPRTLSLLPSIVELVAQQLERVRRSDHLASVPV